MNGWDGGGLEPPNTVIQSLEAAFSDALPVKLLRPIFYNAAALCPPRLRMVEIVFMRSPAPPLWVRTHRLRRLLLRILHYTTSCEYCQVLFFLFLPFLFLVSEVGGSFFFRFDALVAFHPFYQVLFSGFYSLGIGFCRKRSDGFCSVSLFRQVL